MRKFISLAVIAFLFIIHSITASPIQRVFPVLLLSDSTIISEDSNFIQTHLTESDSLIQKNALAKKSIRKKKIVSAICAFPFPLGFVGAHRVMLGTKPWVPVVYVATFGGCFGLLPLIDFCVITFSKDIEQYENNPNIFMWAK